MNAAAPIRSRSKLALKVLVTAIVRAWTFVGALAIIARHLPTMAKADRILLCFEGGFGHTIIAPDLFRRRYPDDSLFVLFAFIPDRHNRWIKSVWESRVKFIWIPVGLALPGTRLIAKMSWSATLFTVLRRILKSIFKHKHILTYERLLEESPRPPWAEPGSMYWHRSESAFHYQITTKPATPIRLPEKLRHPVEAALQQLTGSSFKKRCNLYLRNRKDVFNDTGDVSAVRRQSLAIDQYRPSISYLNRAGYQVLITGDVLLPEEIKSEFGVGVVDWSMLPVDRDAYMVFAGTESDIHIGNLSGGSAYTYVTEIPSLMVDAFTFGEGMPYSTMYYKLLKDPDGNLIPPAELFSKFLFDFECTGYELIDNNADQIEEAVRDFIENHERARPYGIDAEDIGAGTGWLKTAEARLSPVWLKNFAAPAQQHTHRAQS